MRSSNWLAGYLRPSTDRPQTSLCRSGGSQSMYICLYCAHVFSPAPALSRANSRWYSIAAIRLIQPNRVYRGGVGSAQDAQVVPAPVGSVQGVGYDRSSRWEHKDGRLYPKVCHFSRPRPELGATVSTALGRKVGKMAELLMNSTIPSEGSMRASWPRLRNRGYANQTGWRYIVRMCLNRSYVVPPFSRKAPRCIAPGP